MDPDPDLFFDLRSISVSDSSGLEKGDPYPDSTGLTDSVRVRVQNGSCMFCLSLKCNKNVFQPFVEDY